MVLLGASACGRLGFDAISADDAGIDVDGATASDAAMALDSGVDPDLVVWLEFDGDPTAGVVDSMATLPDGSCAPQRCPNTVPGLFGNAAQFDGVDDYLQFDSAATLDFGGTGEAFSVTLWYRATDLTPPLQQVLMAQSTDGGSVSYQLSFEPWQDGPELDLVWKVCETDCQSGQFAVAGDLASVQRWVFIAGVWDGTETRLYVDSTLIASMPKTTITFDGFPFMVGADYETGGSIEDTFNGLIDDLRIYRRALSVKEQQALMARAAGSL